MKYSHQFITGISFGLTSGVITALGMIVGLHAATSSKLAVVAGIIIMAIADGLADAAGIHVAEETEIEKGEIKHSHKEVWLSTIFTFLFVTVFILTFVIPILIFTLRTAVFVAVGWGIFLIISLNYYIARIKKENAVKLIIGHLLLALFVVIISYWVGSLISMWLG